MWTIEKAGGCRAGSGFSFSLSDPARRPPAFLIVSTPREPETSHTVKVAEYHVTDEYQFVPCAKHS